MKLIFSIFTLFFCFTLAIGHTCATYKYLSDKDHSKKLQEVDNIFEGEIISISDLSNSSYLIKFKVLKVWKGEKAKEITVNYGNPCGSFALPLEEMIGARWLVYGYAEKRLEPYLYVNCCHPFDDERMKLEYGEGTGIEHPKRETEQTSQTNESCGSWLWKKIVSFFS